jgi:flagellar hook protein FlgE
MGLFDAMTTAVTGLQAQSYAMGNISGNIANAQTTAYKGINTNFEDLIPDDVPSKQIAGGVVASSMATNTVQGAIQSATVGTDMAINGDGFFEVQKVIGFSGNTPIFSGVNLYTRRGDFQLNAQGYMVNGAGYYLMGLPIDPTTGSPTGSASVPLQFQNNFLPASPTTVIQYGVNLPTDPAASPANKGLINPADFSVDPTTSGAGHVVGTDVNTFVNESIDGGTVTAYSANGTPANVQFRWAKTASASSGGTDTWNLFYQVDSSATGATVAWQNVGTNFKFDASGQLSPPITNLTLNNVSIDGVSLGNLQLQCPAGTVTQFANSSGTASVTNLQQNGYAAGALDSVSVTSKGTISGTFANGKTLDLAQVPLAHFNGPDGLKALDGGAFAVTDESGPALAGATGQILGQSLEGSNTDIATEFTKLIVTQQAYSANTKVISTANQMSQDLLNILR